MNFRNSVPVIQTSLPTPLKRAAKQMKMPEKDFSSGLYHSENAGINQISAVDIRCCSLFEGH